jgi:hypothetical protein
VHAAPLLVQSLFSGLFTSDAAAFGAHFHRGRKAFGTPSENPTDTIYTVTVFFETKALDCVKRSRALCRTSWTPTEQTSLVTYRRARTVLYFFFHPSPSILKFSRSAVNYAKCVRPLFLYTDAPLRPYTLLPLSSLLVRCFLKVACLVGTIKLLALPSVGGFLLYVASLKVGA